MQLTKLSLRLYIMIVRYSLIELGDSYKDYKTFSTTYKRDIHFRNVIMRAKIWADNRNMKNVSFKIGERFPSKIKK